MGIPAVVGDEYDIVHNEHKYYNGGRVSILNLLLMAILNLKFALPSCHQNRNCLAIYDKYVFHTIWV